MFMFMFMFMTKLCLSFVLLLLLVAPLFIDESLCVSAEEVLSLSTDTKDEPISPYSIVIDGGSTGSRLHIFEFVALPNNEHGDTDTTTTSSSSPSTDCVRRGSERSHTPLSDYVDKSPQETAHHLIHVFTYAAQIIPHKYHASTSIKLAATAGMRLLTAQQQEALYDSLYQGLLEHSQFMFTGMQRTDIFTLSGGLEGFYGAVAANFLKGLVNTKLGVVLDDDNVFDVDDGNVFDVDDDNNIITDDTDTVVSVNVQETASSTTPSTISHGLLGALDMGGSSTQIVYMPATTTIQTNDAKQEHQPVRPRQLVEEDHFSSSYLEYGVDRFRERLWDTWVQDRKREDEGYKNDGSNGGDDSCSTKVIDNPCTFVGYEIEWKGYQLIGTGNATACVNQVQRLITNYEPVDAGAAVTLGKGGRRRVGGVEHPPVRGKFFAMSLFYFSLDSLRHLSSGTTTTTRTATGDSIHDNGNNNHKEAHEALNLSWPTPSIQELHDALDGLCSRSWTTDLEQIQHEAHAYTRPEVLPHRCVEAVYMVTLLKDGYGFHPSSRDITFTFLVDGDEVEWSLGLALSMHAAEHQHTTSTDPAANDDDRQQTVETNRTKEEDCDSHFPYQIEDERS